MDEKPTGPDWIKIVGAVAAVIGVLVAIASWHESRSRDRREKEQVPARLVLPSGKSKSPQAPTAAADFRPPGPGMPTVVSFRNDGKQEALVKQIILSDFKWIKTPTRKRSWGAGKMIRVTFEPRHYDQKAGQYTLVLREPAPAPGGGQWTCLEIALVDPNRVGQTLVGTVTIVFDGLEQKPFQNVELDSLELAPPKLDERFG